MSLSPGRRDLHETRNLELELTPGSTDHLGSKVFPSMDISKEIQLARGGLEQVMLRLLPTLGICFPMLEAVREVFLRMQWWVGIAYYGVFSSIAGRQECVCVCLQVQRQVRKSWLSGNRNFPGGPVVQNPPAKAGNTGSTPGLRRSHMPQSSKPVCNDQWACGLYSPCSPTRETSQGDACTPQLESSLRAARKTQCSQE